MVRARLPQDVAVSHREIHAIEEAAAHRLIHVPGDVNANDEAVAYGQDHTHSVDEAPQSHATIPQLAPYCIGHPIAIREGPQSGSVTAAAKCKRSDDKQATTMPPERGRAER